MSTAFKLVVASLLVPLLPALYFLALGGFGFGIIAYLYALAQVVLLGIPIFLILRRFSLLNYRNIALAGFVAAWILVIIMDPPIKWATNYSYSASFFGTTYEQVINGRRTLAGWLIYGYGLLTEGLLGSICALAGLWIWNSLNRKSAQPTPPQTN
jgi:hypothetical protein